MEPFQDPLGRRERWASQDPKVRGALLGHLAILGHPALKGRREKKVTKVTKSMLGGEGEASASSHELPMASQPRASSCNGLWCLGQNLSEG